jgi:predicted metal-binding membrane protein
MFWPRVRNQKLFTGLLLAMVALAWLTLLLWGQSPYGRFLDHGQLAEIEVGLDGGALAFAAAFVAGWTLMTFAMMLPTSLPLLQMFRRMTSRKEHATQLMALVVVGYLATWSAFGVAAHLGDWLLHQQVVERIGWLDGNAWVIGAGTLGLAGAYQFTPLKYMCLDKCRSPFTFLNEHWRGDNERVAALRLGVRHGAFCVGCCWSLMLLMFAVGTGSLGWMLALGAAMAIEKNVSWGKQISAPLGIGLVALAVLAVVLEAPGGACAC